MTIYNIVYYCISFLHHQVNVYTLFHVRFTYLQNNKSYIKMIHCTIKININSRSLKNRYSLQLT